ncbi:MAG: transketolase, partial [Dehalococcoidia bacterium]
GKPTAIIAHTTKGKGVSFMENNPHFHGTAPTREEAERALKELE